MRNNAANCFALKINSPVSGRYYFTRFILLLFLFCSFNKSSSQIVFLSKQIFDFTGADQTLTIPPCARLIKIKIWGAGGGGSLYNSENAGAGAGGYVSGSLAVNPGNVFTIMIGEGGACDGTSDVLSYGFGGSYSALAYGGFGGGLSGMFTGTAPITQTDQARALLIAGGGGASDRGAANNECSSGGQGGDIVFGGGMPDMQGDDGNMINKIGGGGGGGYNGGVITIRLSGNGTTSAGEGGTNFIHSSVTSAVSLSSSDFGTWNTFPATYKEPPNVTDPDYTAWTNSASPGIGSGSMITYSKAGNGRVVIEFYANPFLTASITPADISCPGANNGTAIANPIGGTSPFTYLWNNSLTAQQISNLSPGPYSVTVTDANNCTASASTSITELTAVTIIPSFTNTSACQSAPAQFTDQSTGGSFISWSWDFGDITALGTAQNPAHTYAAQGTYSVKLTVDNGCSTASLTQSVTVFSPPSANVTPNDTICYGGMAQLGVTPNGAGYSYNWLPSAGLSNASIYNPTASPAGTTTYSITLTDANGCKGNGNITIYADPRLILAKSAVNITCHGACNGQTAVIPTGGTMPYFYSWADGGTNAARANLCPGTYTITLTDAYGCTASTDTSITEPAVLTAALVNPVMTSCNGACDGSAAVNVSGGTPGNGYTYSWNTIPAQTAAAAIGLCAGNFTCTVTDANNCAVTAVTAITGPPPVVIAPITNVTACPGGNTLLTAAASGGNAGGYNYSWDAPSNPGFAATAAANVSPVTTTTYTVNAKDVLHNCPALPVTVTVFINPPLTIIAAGDASICFGSSTPLTSNASNGNGGPYTYSWAPAGSLNNPSIGNPIAAPALTTTFTVTAADGCFPPASGTVTVTVYQLPVVSAGTDQTICFGNTVSLAGSIGGTASSGTWSGGTGTYSPDNNSPAAVYTPSTAEETAGTVTLTFTTDDPAGPCSAVSDQLIITINQLPTANAGAAQYVCSGAGILLAGTIGGVAANGIWSGGSGTYSPDNTSLNAVYTASAAEFAAGSVILTLTTNDPAGPCTFSSSNVTFHFYQNPVIDFSADTSIGCPIHCVNFTNTASVGGGSTITSWNWDFGDNGPGSDTPNPSHCFSVSGFYDIRLTAVSNNGCSSSLIKTHLVQALSVPVAAFNPDHNPATVIDPLITMNNQSSSDVNYWFWSFGDGISLASAESSPAHMYQSETAGSYMVTLIVQNANGCYDTVKHEIFIGPEFTFFIPNSFTPNDDGIDDYFFGSGIGIIQYDIWIFDRWGNMIFHGNNLNDKWDGKANFGKETAQEDLYVWKVELADVFNKKHSYIGTVTLVK